MKKLNDKAKLAIIVVPVALIIGYFAMGDFSEPIEKGAEYDSTDPFLTASASSDSIRFKKRTDVFEDKWNKRKEADRKIQGDDSFFDEPVIKEKEPEPEIQEYQSKLIEPQPVQPVQRTYTAPSGSSTASVPKKETYVAPQPTHTKRRRTDPTFGDGPTQVTSQQVNAKAVVHNEQKVTSGQPLQIRIIDPIIIGQCELPANSFVTGTTQFKENRVGVLITSVSCNGRPTPVHWKVFDSQDGLEGIAVSGLSDEQMAGRDVTSEALRETSRALNIPILGQSTPRAGDRAIQNPSVVIRSGIKLLVMEVEK